MASRPQFKVQQFIDVIPGTGGIITKIAAKVGCSWHTAKKYVDNHATVQAAYRDECEKVLDVAESVIIQKITEEEVQTAKWYLKMKGSDRGYAPKQKLEHTGKDGGPIETKVTIEDVLAGLPDGLRDAVRAALLEAIR